MCKLSMPQSCSSRSIGRHTVATANTTFRSANRLSVAVSACFPSHTNLLQVTCGQRVESRGTPPSLTPSRDTSLHEPSYAVAIHDSGHCLGESTCPPGALARAPCSVLGVSCRPGRGADRNHNRNHYRACRRSRQRAPLRRSRRSHLGRDGHCAAYEYETRRPLLLPLPRRRRAVPCPRHLRRHGSRRCNSHAAGRRGPPRSRHSHGANCRAALRRAGQGERRARRRASGIHGWWHRERLARATACPTPGETGPPQRHRRARAGRCHGARYGQHPSVLLRSLAIAHSTSRRCRTIAAASPWRRCSMPAPACWQTLAPARIQCRDSSRS